MGNWNINIQGVGCHHNNKAKFDADVLASEFVEKLKAEGHTVQVATFTYGSLEVIEKAIVPVSLPYNIEVCKG